MSNYEGIKYNFDGANLTGIEAVPTATIVSWSDSTIPSGFLECNGQAVSRTTYADLFAIIGTTYGVGDGSTTFDLPDLQDNVPVGKSNTKALASTGGANTVAPTGNIGGSTANATLSTSQLASHTHPLEVRNPNEGNLADTRVAYGRLPATTGTVNAPAISNAGSGSGHSHNMSANFTGDATSVVQPYLTVIYIIKT